MEVRFHPAEGEDFVELLLQVLAQANLSGLTEEALGAKLQPAAGYMEEPET